MKIVLIDGHSLFFRSFYATAQYDRETKQFIVMKNSKGQATNAVRIFTNLIINTIERYEPDYLGVFFDPPKDKSWRHSYDFYKGNRKSTPAELLEQLPLSFKILDKMKIFNERIEGYEADDLIGTIAKKFEKENEIFVITGDYDFLQLCSSNIKIAITKKGISEVIEYTPKLVEKEFEGLVPEQLKDLKGLMGDTSDNIPGIKGIGKKGAIKLLNEFKSLENLIKNVDDVKGINRERILEQKDIAILSKKLGSIIIDAKNDLSLNDLIFNGSYDDDLKNYLMDLELYAIINKLGL